MPLTQTTLQFQRPRPTLDATVNMAVSRPTISRVSTSSTETISLDDETIVVSNAPNPQLPTPDDSATDASSQSSRTLKIEKVSKGQGKRVTRVGSQVESSSCLVETMEKSDTGSRNVSGQTLVSSGSESSLLRTGIDALNMQWELSRADLALKDNKIMVDEDYEDTINVAAQSVSSPKKPSRREIQQQRDQERQTKYHEADAKATRRSSRVPLLERAGSIVAATASGLGKRSHQAMERGKDRLGSLKRTGSLRPRSAIIESTTIIPSFEGPTTKKRRLSEPLPSKSVADAPTSTTEPQVTVTKPYKPKKYLASGLYAGQPRSFSAGLSGKANKRKSAAAAALEEPLKENSILPLPMFACERLWNIGSNFRLPFDVFSPLPPGQPKPDEWRKMNKNTFVGDAAAYWRSDDSMLKQFRSLCGCSAATGCDDDCQNRIMFYECNENNCSLGPKNCGNRAFADLKERVKKGGKYQIGVEVIKTPDRGNGVRSNRTFRPNQIIVEYSGEIISQDECEHRMRTDYKDNSCYYLMLFDSALIIDASVRGSIARFVNHSCAPNCRMEKWVVNGQPRMALFANGERGIMTGEELTYDYNFDPFSTKNVQECRCGSESCRGILGRRGPGEKKSSSATTKEEGKGGVLAGAKRKLQSILDETMGKEKDSSNSGSKKKKQKKTVTKPPPPPPPSSRNPSSSKQPKSSTTTTKRVVSSPAKRSVSFNAASSKTPSKTTPAAKKSSKIEKRIKTPGHALGKKSSSEQQKKNNAKQNLKSLLGRSRRAALEDVEGEMEKEMVV